MRITALVIAIFATLIIVSFTGQITVLNRVFGDLAQVESGGPPAWAAYLIALILLAGGIGTFFNNVIGALLLLAGAAVIYFFYQFNGLSTVAILLLFLATWLAYDSPNGMISYIRFADSLSQWVGKAFAWAILIMTFSVTYEVLVRYLIGAPTRWSFDVTFIMYGTLFMMGGAYTLSRDGMVRGDFLYRTWPVKVQATIEMILYVLFFFPGITALILAGWKFTARSWRSWEVSISSPAGIPVFQFKSIIVAAGVIVFLQGVASLFRCFIALRTGQWVRAGVDVEETEKVLIAEREAAAAHQHSGEPIDVVLPASLSPPGHTR